MGQHVRCTLPCHRCCRKCFARENGVACEVHTALSLTLQKKGALQEETGRHVRFTPPHCQCCRKKVFVRGNGAACEVHTALSSTPQEKGVLQEETGWRVRFTPPHYRCHRKKVFCERKGGGMWGAHHPVIDATEKMFGERKWGSMWGAHHPIIDPMERTPQGVNELEQGGMWVSCHLISSFLPFGSPPPVSHSTLPAPRWVCCDHVGWGAPGGLR